MNNNKNNQTEPRNIYKQTPQIVPRQNHDMDTGTEKRQTEEPHIKYITYAVNFLIKKNICLL